MALKTSCSIRFLLIADVLADLLQFESDGRDRVSTGPEVLAREVLLSTTQSSYGDCTLSLQQPDHRGYRVLRRNRDAQVHLVWPQMSLDNLPFFLPSQSMENFPQLLADFPEHNLPPPLRASHIMPMFWGPPLFIIVGIL
jgi:hypothetical protein